MGMQPCVGSSAKLNDRVATFVRCQLIDDIYVFFVGLSQVKSRLL